MSEEPEQVLKHLITDIQISGPKVKIVDVFKIPSSDQLHTNSTHKSFEIFETELIMTSKKRKSQYIDNKSNTSKREKR